MSGSRRDEKFSKNNGQKNNSSAARAPKNSNTTADNLNKTSPPALNKNTKTHKKVQFVDMSHQPDNDNTDENEIAAASLIASLGYPQTMLNSAVTFSNILAHDPETIHCIGGGNCAMDGITKGLHLHQMYMDYTHSDLRALLSAHALEHPDQVIGMDLTIEQVTVLSQNLNPRQRRVVFNNLWTRAKSPGVYTDDFALHVSAAVLSIELWIWRRTSNRPMRLAQRFVPLENAPAPQIHLILDGEVNSDRGRDAHFTLIRSYKYVNPRGEWVDVNAQHPDQRFTESEQEPTPPARYQAPTSTDPASVTAHMTAPTVTSSRPEASATPASSQNTPTTPAHIQPTPTITKLRPRCSGLSCTRTPCTESIQQKKTLCAPCLKLDMRALCCSCQNETPCAGSTLCQPCRDLAHEDSDSDSTRIMDNNYAMAWTDGGRRDVYVTTQLSTNRKESKLLKDVGGWAFLLLCGRGEKYIASGCVGGNSTNNIGEFEAIKKVMLKAVEANIKQLDINTDSMLAVQYYDGTIARNAHHLAILFQEIEEIAATHKIQFKLKHVKAHADDRNNKLVDSMCTAVILAVDTEPRYVGPTKIAPFPAPNPCAQPRTDVNSLAKYQTFAPYSPFNVDDAPMRGVSDLSDDRGNILFICPQCDQSCPNILKDRRGLLTHLRQVHHKEVVTPITQPVQELFGISLCVKCELHYSKTSIANHNCKPDVVRKPQHQRPNTLPTPPKPRTKQTKTTKIMLRPSEISPELVDRLTAISYDEIFSSQAYTILELHHSSVNMWSSVVALLLEGIVMYAYGGVYGSETAVMAEAFLKLFLLAPRLLLHSSRGVAERARVLLTGTVESFDSLYEATHKPPTPAQSKTDAQKTQQVAERVSKLVESCDLSRAINLLMNVPPPAITSALTDKIRALHPTAQPEHRIPDSAPTRITIGPDEELFAESHLAKVVKDLRPHAAPDTTGLRANHIKCIFRGKRELGSPEVRSRFALYRLLHKTLEDPDRLGPEDFWRHFAGGKLSVITAKARPVGQKNLLLKIIQSINDRAHNKELLLLAGPAHLAGKKNGVLAAALMAQMEVDYAQHIVEDDAREIRCILTTDAKAAFQSASRKHCYDVLCSDDKLKERFAPFFAKTHKGAQKITWLAGKTVFEPSSGFTQGDINASKLYTCNTAALVRGLQASSPVEGVVLAVVDDITLMGTLKAVVTMEASRSELQKAPNYIVNPLKQHVYTVNEDHVEEIKQQLPDHDVFYIGDTAGFQLSGIPVGGEAYIRRKLQENIDGTTSVIEAITTKLSSKQEKLILLLQCIPGRIQHLLAAVTPSISREFARQHDVAIREAVASVLDLGLLTDRDMLLMQRKICDHGLGLRSMEGNLEFLFLAGFMRTAGTIKKSFPQFVPIMQHTMSGESGYGAQLVDALQSLRDLRCRRLNDLLPCTLQEALGENYQWPHDAIQRELDQLLSERHDESFDLTRIPDQQDKATMLSTDASIFLLVPRSKTLRIPNEQLTYLAKQLFGKAQRTNVRKYCPNVATSTGAICGIALDTRDIHLRTCRMNNVNHVKHAAVQAWFQDFAKQAHIATQPAPPISTVSPRNPTKQLAGDLLLVDVSLQDKEKDGECCVIDFSIVTPAAESYCEEASTTPLYTAKLKEREKINKYASEYKKQDNTHFEPFVIESGGVFGECAKNVFSKICNIITQITGQSRSNIAYFWKSRLLVILAKITHANALKWALAHNIPHDPTSGIEDLSGCYENDNMEDIRRMCHSGADQRLNFLSNNTICPAID